MDRKEIYERYYNSPKGRANYLAKNYKKQDKIRNHGEGNLTSKWILDNILFQPCAHCGNIGWEIIGCNRLDNNKPHTTDNVEPCCFDCNNKLAHEEQKTTLKNRKDASKIVYQYSLDNELIAIFPSGKECQRNGFDGSAISSCCNGKLKTHKGYKWTRTPL